MIKQTPNGIYISDDLTLDLSRVKTELKNNFVKKVRDFEQTGRTGVAPKLVVSVAATHAGLPTGNMAFYTPDRMRTGLPTFTKDFAKPVLLHHNDMKDPVGRVHKATYRDLSHKYLEPMAAFKERYGANIFTDAKENIDLEKTFDQVDWILENMVPMKDYVGLGYGELDLHITDSEAAEKIIDQRYLTVSVGFTTDSAYCSNCHQDWASEGFCEHERGKTYDGKKTLVIPGKFSYEEVSWVNSPADSGAKVLSVSETPSLAGTETIQALETVQNTQDSMCLPILISVSDGNVSRLDSFKKITPERAQEVIDVVKQKDNTQPKAPELVKATIDDSDYEFVPEASELLKAEDAKRENYITDEAHGHKHRVIIDPETGNGFTSFDDGHSHEVVNRDVRESGEREFNEETGNVTMTGMHSHELDKKVAPLTDNKEKEKGKVADSSNEEKEEDAYSKSGSSKSKKKRKAKKIADSEVEGDEEIELEDDAEVPEGYELIEDSTEENEEVTDPTDFNLTDLESVLAARQAVNDSDLTDSVKARTLIAINKKADELGLTDSKHEFDVVEVELIDPKNEDAKIKLAFTSEESFRESLAEMTQEAVEANKDQLEKACAVFGAELPLFNDDATAASGTPLTKAEAQAAAEALFNNINKAFVDKLIIAMNNMGSDDERKEVAAYIVDQLIEETMIDNIFAEYNALQQELQDAREKLAKVTKANRDFYASKQDDLARVVVALKVALKKPEFVDLDEEAQAAKTKELKVRSVDSLQDSLGDLINEFSGKEVETANTVSETPVEPEVGDILNKDDNNRLNMEVFRDMDDGAYAIASHLQNRFKQRS